MFSFIFFIRWLLLFEVCESKISRIISIIWVSRCITISLSMRVKTYLSLLDISRTDWSFKSRYYSEHFHSFVINEKKEIFVFEFKTKNQKDGNWISLEIRNWKLDGFWKLSLCFGRFYRSCEDFWEQFGSLKYK